MEFKGTEGDFKIGVAFQGETDNFKIKTNGQLLVIEDRDGRAVAILGRITEPEVKANAKLFVQSKKMFEFLLDIYEQEEGISQICHDELYEFLTKIS